MMNLNALWLVCLSSLTMVFSLPILIMQPQELRLQEQLQSLQQAPFGEKRWNLNWPQPLIIFSPLDNYLMRVHKTSNNDHRIEELNNKNKSDDEDSLVIDAHEDTNDSALNPQLKTSSKEERFFVGQIISAIPWLPFEVNVPDTVTWIWNGISGVWSGIGQRFPLRPRPMAMPTEDPSLKLLMNTDPEQFPLLSGPILMLPGPIWLRIPNFN